MRLEHYCLALVLFIVTSCRPNDSSTVGHVQTSEEAEKTANEYLATKLSIGHSRDKLEEIFGIPFEEYKSTNDETVLMFIFPPEDEQAEAFGVGGFYAYLLSNRLHRYSPVYRTVWDAQTTHVANQPESLGGVGRVPLTVFELSPAAGNGGKRIGDLGYISPSPNVTIQSWRYEFREPEDGKEVQRLTIAIGPEDAKSFGMFTETNLGARIVIMIGSNVLASPLLMTPIFDQQISLSVSNGVRSIL